MRREFPAKVKLAVLKRCTGPDGIPRCEKCGVKGIVHIDHIKPDGLGGEPVLENAMALCIKCHNEKTTTEDTPIMNKADRQRKSHFLGKVSRNPLPGSKKSKWKKKLNGQVVER